MSRKAVILYSGGLDSTTCLAIAKAEGFTPYAMSFAYGQRHSIELDRAKEYAPKQGVTDHLLENARKLDTIQEKVDEVAAEVRARP